MWDDLARAIALVLVIEGMVPFIAPQLWRRMILEVMRLDDRALRRGGLAMMVIGVVFLYLIR
jgi:uncharacterized protein YjeT (DUF2065 family)